MSDAIVKSIALCNFAFKDEMHRWSLISMFDAMVAEKLPMPSPSFFIFTKIMDPPKRAVMTYQIEDPKGMVVWTSGQIPYEIPEITRVMDAVFSIPPVIMLTSRGRYTVSMFINSERLIDTPFDVVEPRV